MSVLRSPLINPLRSPLYSPLLSSVAWWGNYNPSTGFAYDFKLNRYMSQGKSIGIAQAVTEGRSTDAYVLDGGGNYILRYAPRTNLCLNKDFTALSADINTTVTHMPLEPGMDGSLGNVYRIQFPATTDTKLVLANVTSASPHTVSLNAKKFDPSNTQFGLFTTGGSPDTANFVATDDWVRVAFFPTSVSGDIFLLNVGDAYITDILVEKPQVELGDTATPYIETTGTAVTVPAEPAQANGHGLDGFDEYTNEFLISRRVLGLDANTASPVAYTGISPFGDVGGRVYTSTGFVQTNSNIVADSATWLVSRHFKPLSSGARFTSNAIGIAGVDLPGVVYDFDTASTISGRAPTTVQALANGWVRLMWAFQNTGAGTLIVWKEDITGDSDYASDQTDIVQASSLRPPIITTGTALTRDADDTRVVQGEGPELVTNGTFATGDFTNWIVTENGGTPVAPSVTAGVASLPRSAGGATSILEQQIADDLIIGATYTYTFIQGIANMRLRVGTTRGGADYASVEGAAPGDKEFSFVATSTDAWLYFLPFVNGTTPTISNIQLKSVTIAPGFSANPTELTFRVDWDGVPTDGSSDRNLFEVINSSNDTLTLLFGAGASALLFAGNVTGFMSINLGSSFNDGGTHTAICYVNQATSEFKISVDGATTVTSTLTGAVPANMDEMGINRRIASGASNNANGTNCRIQVAEGDFYEIFRDSSAGFF